MKFKKSNGKNEYKDYIKISPCCFVNLNLFKLLIHALKELPNEKGVQKILLWPRIIGKDDICNICTRIMKIFALRILNHPKIHIFDSKLWIFLPIFLENCLFKLPV